MDDGEPAMMDNGLDPANGRPNETGIAEASADADAEALNPRSGIEPEDNAADANDCSGLPLSRCECTPRRNDDVPRRIRFDRCLRQPRAAVPNAGHLAFRGRMHRNESGAMLAWSAR